MYHSEQEANSAGFKCASPAKYQHPVSFRKCKSAGRGIIAIQAFLMLTLLAGITINLFFHST